MRVLVTGASGLLGACVAVKLASTGHDVLGTYFTHGGDFPFPAARVDLSSSVEVADLFAKFTPREIIHTAALSKVLDCEQNPAAARRHNVTATGLLAELAERREAHFIFISTDQVFDGRRGLFVEQEAPAPTHEYGRQKSEAERIVLEACSSSLIVRSNNIVGRSVGFGSSFTDMLLPSLLRGQSIELFSDQYRSPIHLQVISELLVRCAGGRVCGILHAGGPQRLSRYETGVLLATAYGVDTSLIRPVSVSSHPQATVLHHDGSFKTDKLKSLFPDLGETAIEAGFLNDAVQSGRNRERN